MNINKILDAVEELHTKAIHSGQIEINKIIYYLNFDGHNYRITSSDKKTDLTFNTRKINVAKKWLREYLLN